MERQSAAPGASPSHGDAVALRKRFAATLHARLEELGVEPQHRVTWLVQRIEAAGGKLRWQTAQHWLDAVSFPQGRNLSRLAGVLAMKMDELVGPLDDSDDPTAFRSFLEREGGSLTQQERTTLRLFPWPKDPTVADYRSLLAVLRSNAER